MINLRLVDSHEIEMDVFHCWGVTQGSAWARRSNDDLCSRSTDWWRVLRVCESLVIEPFEEHSHSDVAEEWFWQMALPDVGERPGAGELLIPLPLQVDTSVDEIDF